MSLRQDLRGTVDGLLPELKALLEQLVSIPSIAFPDYPREHVQRAHDLVADELRKSGVADLQVLTLPETAPVIYGRIPAPEGAPTVLLYGHYDVQPSGDESLWNTPPFTPTEQDGAIYGRGAADCKANVVAHIGALRAYGGKPPVGVTIVIEGQEEYGSAFDDYPAEHPDLFQADALLICDAGNIRAGTPTLVTALRGVADVFVEVRTLAAPVHSGQFGGAAPDALLALMAGLATLHDAKGDVAVRGLRRDKWAGANYTDAEFAEITGMAPGMPLLGSGPIGERIWYGPAITIIGLDAPPVKTAASAVVPYARAYLNVRVHPEQDPAQGQQAVIEHLRKVRPFGIELTVTGGDVGSGFAAGTSGPAYAAMREAMAKAWGADVVDSAMGGSIPLTNAMAQANPGAEVLMLGAEDGKANIHGYNERVLVSELAATALAEAEFFQLFADRMRS
ncbi:M20/M25/M40 family metallo-hydrolase [Nocardia sp. 2]|uniref:M20/M25/M40 family metallo-hydrolase n=1 Tax=Nocardia acididurans TaxID=2802282 RepID=A0ABS1MEQ1_9NOCA|nr:M20/M25/M40 family metallo-hydrolase [Nocardia acididurans]MBL1078219.1 M20/M25/M40 family metallo-hydrolase [Nocardia acididurans]